MKSADHLRQELQKLAEARKAHASQGAEIEKVTARLSREAREHPDLSMVEAAQLAGFKRRATFYGYTERDLPPTTGE